LIWLLGDVLFFLIIELVIIVLRLLDLLSKVNWKEVIFLRDCFLGWDEWLTIWIQLISFLSTLSFDFLLCINNLLLPILHNLQSYLLLHVMINEAKEARAIKQLKTRLVTHSLPQFFLNLRDLKPFP